VGRLGLLGAAALVGGGIVLALTHGAAPASGQPTGPPVLTTAPATNAHADSVRLHGTVNPNGLETTYRFEYGRTTSYGSSTPAGDAGAGVTSARVKAAVSGLKPGTTYHFRLTANNAGGTASSDDATFTTRDPRLNGAYAVRLRVLAGGGAIGGHEAGVARRIYRFGARCRGARCPAVHLTREGRRGRFKSVLRRQSGGVYAGTERFGGGRCDDGLRFHSVAEIRVTVRRLAGDRAAGIRGRFKVRAKGCAGGHERARLRGTLRG
jgi:hypothetical protein